MSSPWQSRATGTELLDGGGYSQDEARGTLADLRRYNRWFGGTAAALGALGRLWEDSGRPSRLTVLDVATGTGDIPAAIARWAGARGIHVTATGLDQNGDVLKEARASLAGTPVSLVGGDAQALPLVSQSIDVVLCCTFLHHLDGLSEGDPLVRALAEMRRVARLGVIVIDLQRTPLAGRLVGLATTLTSTNRLTRHDGALSVRRALTPAELLKAAERAGLSGAVVRRVGPVRMALRWRCAGRGREEADSTEAVPSTSGL